MKSQADLVVDELLIKLMAAEKENAILKANNTLLQAEMLELIKPKEKENQDG